MSQYIEYFKEKWVYPIIFAALFFGIFAIAILLAGGLND